MPRESSKSRSSKTNKTSHVLSLLTNDSESVEELAPAPEPRTSAPEEQKPAQEPAAPKPSRSRKKKTVQTDGEQAIASEIRNALEDALKAEETTPEAKPAEAAAPVREPAPVPEPEPRAEAPSVPVRFDFPSFDPPEPPSWESPYEPEKEPVVTAGPSGPEPAVTEPTPAQHARPKPPAAEPVFTPPEPPKAAPKPPKPVPEPPKAAPKPREPVPEPPKTAPRPPEPVPGPPSDTAAGPDSEPFCFNVMEALVESKAEKYIDLFGLCPCPRCRTDVVALALTRLPAKYVVATRADLVPLLSVYEGRYNAAVVSQVMRACNRVANQPRHKKS